MYEAELLEAKEVLRSRMTPAQQLHEALREAAEAGVLDELAADIHPDCINEFCDAVAGRAAFNPSEQVLETK